MSSEARGGEPRAIGSILAEIVTAGEFGSNPAAGRTPIPPAKPKRRRAVSAAPRGAVFDLDLAEFPLFRFSASSRIRRRSEPLVYKDTITARDGSRVERVWQAIPGPEGVGGPSAQLLLFDLIQLYAEQGGRGPSIRYGSMRSLLTRRGLRHPSRRDFDRLRRDLTILKGYEIRGSNAFWDQAAGRYVDRTWRILPASVEFPRGRARHAGAIGVGDVLREIATGRGFFALGFDRAAFYRMRPLEQRLALYLARKFRFQSIHRRYIEDLARALPLEASRDRDVRASVTRAARSIASGGPPILRDFRMTRTRHGRWIAEFDRGPSYDAVGSARELGGREIDAERIEAQLERIIELTGIPRDRAWWTHCVARLGHGPIDRALGQLREACRTGQVRNRGALLTKILKDIAAESGIGLRD